jgi:DNA-binding transcriptional MerR regulator
MVRVGDLAEAAGLTVRALHHYEQVGLLRPTARTAAGHRLYGRDAVTRLYRVTRLRSLGMPLHQIRRVLDEPHLDLRGALRGHLESVDRQTSALAAIRRSLRAALDGLDEGHSDSIDLLEVLSSMSNVTQLVRGRVSIMVYRDLPAAHRYLTDVFGFAPGEVTTDADGRPVHAEVMAGDDVIWLHPESSEYQLASPQSLHAATACLAVMVDDVDQHHAMVAETGGHIVYPPVDQPYGYREYSARDLEGALWSFMKEIST